MVSEDISLERKTSSLRKPARKTFFSLLTTSVSLLNTASAAVFTLGTLSQDFRFQGIRIKMKS
jgi:hypothetical protein